MKFTSSITLAFVLISSVIAQSMHAAPQTMSLATEGDMNGDMLLERRSPGRHGRGVRRARIHIRRANRKARNGHKGKGREARKADRKARLAARIAQRVAQRAA
jgi:hypothetical protein